MHARAKYPAGSRPRSGSPSLSSDAACADLKTYAPAWRDEIHEGIDDADYATTLRVLQRIMRNVGSELA